MSASTELKSLLIANGVDQRIIDWLAHESQGIRSLKNFANCVDSRSEVKSVLLDKTPPRDSVGQLAALSVTRWSVKAWGGEHSHNTYHGSASGLKCNQVVSKGLGGSTQTQFLSWVS